MNTVKELLDQGEIELTIKELYKQGSNVKKDYAGPDYQNLNNFSVNITYSDPVALRDVDFTA